jgi:hypothetical protein
MAAPITFYSDDLAGREPIAAMEQTSDFIARLVERWSASDFERRYAPGKWTARELLAHLAQTEMALGTRARMALATPDYAAQNFDQDVWIRREVVGGADAVAAFTALGRMNRSLFASLSPEERATPLTHPEYGPLTVDWIIHQMAGHQIHHLKHLQQIR